jgi:hypothetical protein
MQSTSRSTHKVVKIFAIKAYIRARTIDIAVDELSTSLTAICLIASIPLGRLSALCVEELD